MEAGGEGWEGLLGSAGAARQDAGAAVWLPHMAPSCTVYAGGKKCSWCSFALPQVPVPYLLSLLPQVASINTAMASLVKTLNIFPRERTIVARERARGSYSILSYLSAKLAAELPVGECTARVCVCVALLGCSWRRGAWAQEAVEQLPCALLLDVDLLGRLV